MGHGQQRGSSDGNIPLTGLSGRFAQARHWVGFSPSDCVAVRRKEI